MEPRDFTKAFFFDVATENFFNLADRITARCGETKERDWLIGVYGDMDVAILADTPTITAVYCKVQPNMSVKPHSHGRNQIAFVVKGSLHFGTKVLGPGMGRFGPDKFYSWTTGPEGCEFIEIMDGPAGVRTPQGTEREFQTA